MLRTAVSAPACDAEGGVQSRTDEEFLRAVATALASDGKVQPVARFACHFNSAITEWL